MIYFAPYLIITLMLMKRKQKIHHLPGLYVYPPHIALKR